MYSIVTIMSGGVSWVDNSTKRMPPQVFDLLLRRSVGEESTINRADHPISYLDTLIKTGSENIEATLRRRRTLFAGFVARSMEDTRLPKCACDVRRISGGRGLCGGAGKRSLHGV